MEDAMNRLCAKLWVRLLFVGLVTGCLAAFSASWYFRVWSYKDYQAFMEVRRYPVGEDLWFGRIKAGEDLQAFTVAHPPHRVCRIGSFTVLSYFSTWPLPPNLISFESLGVIGKDGRLIHAVAAGCTWKRMFFAMNPEDEMELDEEYRQLWAKRDKE
jgi:hypothetical protein